MGMKDSDKDRMIDISAAGGKRKGTGRHGFANRASPKPSFYLKHVPVFEEQVILASRHSLLSLLLLGSPQKATDSQWYHSGLRNVT